MMSRLRGLLPGVLLVVVLPLTQALIAIAIGATTLHQNEMRALIAQRDERAVREAANSLAERVNHQAQLAQAVAGLVQAGVPLAEAQQRLGVTGSGTLTPQALDLPAFAEGLRGPSQLHVMVLDQFNTALSAAIRDDGVGFAMPDRVDVLTDRGHFGLIGMRERAELIGARLAIHSSPGQGTTVEVTLPVFTPAKWPTSNHAG